MDIQASKNGTGRPIGFASKLRRYGASLANHRNYNRRQFILTLADCCKNLGVEKKPNTSENSVVDNVEEVGQLDTKFEWQTLQCPKCYRKAEDTQLLLDHLVEYHGRPEDKLWYREFKTVGLELNKLFEKAVAKQNENSYLKRKFDNSDDFLICPTNSPLAPYIMMRHLQVFIREMPSTVSDGISLKLQSGETNHVVIFSFQKVDKARRRIKRTMAKKESENKLKELEKHCARVWIEDVDVCSKKSRNSESFKALAHAFNLPPTCSHDEIMKHVNDIKSKHEEINPFCSNIYSKVVKPNGQVMSKEEKRLISSLTNDMMMPVSGKRKTTFKNPSELQPLKKRQKTTSPQ